MMEDWTDIIAEELKDVEETLPADDWSVLQQKYAAARRRKRAAVYAWTGAVASVAAVLAVAVLIFRGSSSVYPDNQYVAEQTAPVLPSTESASVSEPVPEAVPDTVPLSDKDVEVKDVEVTDEIFQVIADTTAVTERLVAQADAHADTGDSAGKDEVTYEDGGMRFEDFPIEEVKRERIRMSLGLSGSVSGTPMFAVMMDASPDFDQLDKPEPPYSGDSLYVPDPPEKMAVMSRGKSSYRDKYSHHIPVSVGVSARFHLNNRFSLNTGLNYTRYSSVRSRIFSNNHVQTDDQQVHYLGIPLRADWMFVNRKYFNMYLGAGVQMDKCVYAKVGSERLHEGRFLFGVTGALGMQVNFTPAVGLYFEPDVSYSLNESTLETFRSKHRTMISVRAGLRFNL